MLHVLAKDDDYVDTIHNSTVFTQRREDKGMLDNMISMFKGDDIGYYSSAEIENHLLHGAFQ